MDKMSRKEAREKQIKKTKVIIGSIVFVAGTYYTLRAGGNYQEFSPNVGHTYTNISAPEQEVYIPKEIVLEDIAEPVICVETILNEYLEGKLANTGDSFLRYGLEYRVDPILLAAIAIHETGNGSSKAINELNNAGGLMQDPANGILMRFISVNASIEYMAWLIRNSYMDARNLYTISEIGNRYCPIGVNNDPTNINQHWIPRVAQIYRQIAGVDYMGR
jgi:hypothetical protein